MIFLFLDILPDVSMKLLKPHQRSPKQWITFCNTFLLSLVTFMCGLVIYEISILDRRFISVLDSSTVAIDLLAVNLANSHKTPFWRNVTGEISVYSAFYDINKEEANHILIIGSFSNKEILTGDIRCLIDYADDGDVGIEHVSYKVVPNRNAIFLYCPAGKEKIPKRVALVSYASSIPKQWMHVFIIHSRMETDLKMVACVHPITNKVNVKQIAEFIDFYEHIGIEHFNFYDGTAAEDAIGFLQYLKDTDGHSVNILPWNKDVKEIDFHGSESEHIQDCLHRVMNKYSDVITVELSDFFFPVEKGNLIEMVGNYRRSKGSPSKLRLYCADFCKEPNDMKDSANMTHNVFRGKSRLSDTNYILIPDSSAALNSFTAKFENKSLKNLSEKYGLVHHFRNKCDKNLALDKDN